MPRISKSMVCAVNDIRRIKKMNEYCKNLDKFDFEVNYSHMKLDYIELDDFLSTFPIGSVSITGPGKGIGWWPDALKEKHLLFDKVAENCFAPLRGYDHPVFEGPTSRVIQEMDRFYSAGERDEHFEKKSC